MSHMGHSRRFDHVRDESGLPPIPDLLRIATSLIDRTHFEILGPWGMGSGAGGLVLVVMHVLLTDLACHLLLRAVERRER
jgi:hypothetical protein